MCQLKFFMIFLFRLLESYT